MSHDRALLRALASRVWILHDRHITAFDGSFAEWELASAERAHAAAVRAAEEQALGRMRERQKTGRRDMGERDQRDALRRARRAAEEAEAEVAALEKRVTELTTLLADPELYTRADGPMTASRFGAELEVVKLALDRAIETWTAATEEAETLAASASGA